MNRSLFVLILVVIVSTVVLSAPAPFLGGLLGLAENALLGPGHGYGYGGHHHHLGGYPHGGGFGHHHHFGGYPHGGGFGGYPYGGGFYGGYPGYGYGGFGK